MSWVLIRRKKLSYVFVFRLGSDRGLTFFFFLVSFCCGESTTRLSCHSTTFSFARISAQKFINSSWSCSTLPRQIRKWSQILFNSSTDPTNRHPHHITRFFWTSSAIFGPRSFTFLGIDGGNALALFNDSGAEMSRMGLADAKAFSLENYCGWWRKWSRGMGTNAGFENCSNLKQFLCNDVSYRRLLAYQRRQIPSVEYQSINESWAMKIDEHSS